jgi:hypothetical protein
MEEHRSLSRLEKRGREASFRGIPTVVALEWIGPWIFGAEPLRFSCHLMIAATIVIGFLSLLDATINSV